MATLSATGQRASDLTRWTQLVLGIVCMVMIANLQYGWTLFTIPMKDSFGWSLASIQVAFTLFVLFETWLVPAEGYLVDRFGPRIVVLVGGLLAGLAWILNSYASTLAMLYLAQIIGGIGAGAVYGTAVGNALKCTDCFGVKYATTNAGLLYTAKGTAALLVPLANLLVMATGGWKIAFIIASVLNLVAAVMALIVLKPMRKKLMSQSPLPVVETIRQAA